MAGRRAGLPPSFSRLARRATATRHRTPRGDNHEASIQTDPGRLRAGRAGLVRQAQVSDDVVKIGVLGDQSGMMADLSGKYGVEAVKMAVEDFGGTVLGKPIEVISADHQNKVDIGVATARRWYERQGRPDPGRAQLRHRAGGAGPDAADEARGDLHQRRLGRPDRQGLLAQWHALDLRHLCLRHRRGQRRHGRRRQELVLHHVRLRLRPLAGTRRDGGGQEQGRPGAGQRAPSHRQCRLLVASCCRRRRPRPR